MKRYFYPHRFVFRAEDAPAMKQQSLDVALDRLGVIEQHLRERGPHHLGERFSLVDLTMTYWAACIDSADVLEPYPALRRCMMLVVERPKLRPKFDDLKASKEEYTQMQARGEGVE